MKRLVAIFLILAAVSGMAGCGGKNPQETDSQGGAGSAGSGPISFTATVLTNAGDQSDTVAQKAWLALIQKKAGRKIDIKFSYIPGSDYNEKFQLMVSSDTLTDVTTVPSFYDLTKAKEEGMFADLSQYEKDMPNYMKTVEEAYDGKILNSDADGHVYVFNPAGLPRFPKDKGLDPNSLTAYRYDVFQKNNIPIPETLDEFYDAAVKLKKLYPDKYPVNVQFNDLQMVFNANHTSNEFYYDGKDYRFGPFDQGYKDALTYVNKLYVQKLLDPEYLVDTTDTLQQKAFNDKNFMWLRMWFTTPGVWTNQLNNGKIFAVTYYPDNPTYGTAWQSAQDVNDVILNVGWGGMVVRANAENIADIIKAVDLSYDPDVIRTVTWGVEGTTYQLEPDGKPKFVDTILKATDPWTEGDKYGIRASRNHCPGFALADDSAAYVDLATDDYIVYNHTLHKEPIEKSTNFTDVDMKTSKMVPPSYHGPTLQFTADEQQQISTTMNAIQTYRDEMQSKFIKGDESFDNWGKFTSQLKDMGVDKVLKIYNDALQRYQQRKASES